MINHKFTFIAVETGLAAKGYKTNNSDRYKALANGWLPTNGRQQSSVGVSAIKVCKRTPALSHRHSPLQLIFNISWKFFSSHLLILSRTTFCF